MPVYYTPTPVKASKPRRRTSPQHLRGKVFKQGDTWWMRVVNTRTDEVVAQDNTGSWDRMQEACDTVTGAVRMSWTMGFGNAGVTR